MDFIVNRSEEQNTIQKNTSFSQEDSLIAKSIAIILMVSHHLFRFPDRLVEATYTPIFPFFLNFEFWVGDFGKICVAMYLFLSGYGLFHIITRSEKTVREVIKRGFKFFLNYWIVLLIFIPIGLIFYNDNPRYYWNIETFFLNFFALSSSYNGEWWFAKLYIELLFFALVLKRLFLKNKVITIVAIILGIYIGSFGISWVIKFLPEGIFKYIIKSFQELCFWQINFSLGFLFAKYNIYTVICSQVKKYKMNSHWIYLFFTLVFVIIRISMTLLFNKFGKGNAAYIDFLLAPLFIFSVTQLFNRDGYITKILSFLGRHSTNIWLTHTFFCYYYFQQYVFAPKISLLIVLWVLILSSISSIFINFILNRVQLMVSLGDKNFIQKINTKFN